MAAELPLMDEYGVSLSEAISLLRSELEEAMSTGEGERVRFAIESVNLELELVARVTRNVKGELSLWKVLTAGAGRENNNAATHRVTLTIKPRDQRLPPQDETLIGDES